MNSQQEINSLVDEFFGSAHEPVSTHEEWLLRRCAQLMEREAASVRVLESQARTSKTSKHANRRKDDTVTPMALVSPPQKPSQGMETSTPTEE